MDEKRFFFGWLPVMVVFWFVVIGLLCFAGGAGYVVYVKVIRTEQIAAETTAVRASLPYVDGKNQHLLSLIHEFDVLEVEEAKATDQGVKDAVAVQQVGDLHRICEEAGLLRDSQLVVAVQEFLDKHPCSAR